MKLLPLFFIVCVTGNIFAADNSDLYGRPIGKPIIEEPDIPLPEIKYELPEALIGEFIMNSSAYNHHITIFPNNKYIVFYDVPYHTPGISFGYIVNKDGKWYFTRAPGREGRYYFYLEDKEIHLTDSGFSYYRNGSFFSSIRKENLPVPENLAEDITILAIDARNQYFILNELDNVKLEFNELEPITYDKNHFWIHRLKIDKGIVRITRVDDGLGIIEFDGFMEKTSEDVNGMKGVIRFTNGVPYHYIDDGIAEIEINNDGEIIITMFYTPHSRIGIENLKKNTNYSHIIEGLQFPVKLVLEF
jgi:hypothetical protein